MTYLFQIMQRPVKVSKKPKSLRFMLENPTKEAIQAYLNEGGCINQVYKKTTALCDATRKNYINVVEWLLTIGAQINLCDGYGCTPLHVAASHGLMDLVGFLLDKGAHTEGVFGMRRHDNIKMTLTVKSGYTPLVSAIQNNHMDCARLLIERGANVNVTWQNSYGANLNLFTQVLFGKHDPDLALLLLQAGVCPYPLMKPLVFMLMQDSKVTYKFIRTMVAVGFRLPIDGYRDLCLLGQLDSTPEQEEVLSFLEHSQHHPLTLYQFCRKVIRTALCRSPQRLHISEKISQLLLPSNVQKFVELHENYL